ncbi:MAG: hypothetical protein Q8T03_12080 [Bacteroidota bacterium]|nr:hypothetical protein [Bacteroidota bacterium]
MDNTQTTNVKKGGGKKLLFLGLGLLTTGVLSFFGYRYWKSNKKQTEKPESNAPNFKAEKPKTSVKPKPKTQKPPAKKPVSKNTAKPKAAANTTNAPKNPEPVINKPKFEPGLIARGLQLAIKAKSFSSALRILKVIKSVAQYESVNKVFQSYRINSVRQTIVNGLLSTFKDEKQKQELRQAFTTIGLKYDGKIWTLSGIESKPMLITLQGTKIWKDPKTSVEVPKNMVLGREIAKRKNFSLFENDKQLFLVESKHVTNYKK